MELARYAPKGLVRRHLRQADEALASSFNKRACERTRIVLRATFEPESDEEDQERLGPLHVVPSS